MPLYDMECDQCDYSREILVKSVDGARSFGCLDPRCSGTVSRLPSAPAFGINDTFVTGRLGHGQGSKKKDTRIDDFD